MAVVDATTDDPDCVHLRSELDDVTEEYLPRYVVDLKLTPDQARELAADLERAADRVEDGEGASAT